MRQGLAHLLAPDVLADRHADLDPPEIDRLRGGTRRKDALLVEHPVIREIVLVADRLDAAGIEQRHGVVDEGAVAPGQPDEDGGAAVGGVAGKLLSGFAGGLLQCGLQHQVLDGVAGEIKLAEGDEIGARFRGARARLASFAQIALEVAHHRVELRQRELK